MVPIIDSIGRSEFEPNRLVYQYYFIAFNSRKPYVNVVNRFQLFSTDSCLTNPTYVGIICTIQNKCLVILMGIIQLLA